MGGGRGLGGSGRGMGGGGGMGMGGRCATPTSSATADGSSQKSGLSREHEIDELQQQSALLKKQMDEIQNRIKELT
jgi:hypothetical protein